MPRTIANPPQTVPSSSNGHKVNIHEVKIKCSFLNKKKHFRIMKRIADFKSFNLLAIHQRNVWRKIFFASFRNISFRQKPNITELKVDTISAIVMLHANTTTPAKLCFKACFYSKLTTAVCKKTQKGTAHYNKARLCQFCFHLLTCISHGIRDTVQIARSCFSTN